MTNYHHNKRVATEIITRDDNAVALVTALPAGRSLRFRVDSPQGRLTRGDKRCDRSGSKPVSPRIIIVKGSNFFYKSNIYI